MSGKLIIVDGIDCSGKSVLVEGIARRLESSGRRVFNLSQYCKKAQSFPLPEELLDYEVIVSNEPTNTWIGKAIREEFIKKSERHYTAEQTASAFALDRLVLYTRIFIPLLARGKTIINDRSVTTSIVYQPIQAEPLELEKVLSLEGNRLAMHYRPDLLIVALCPPAVAVERLKKRDKNDDSIFDRLSFLENADARFRSKWFRELFEQRGTKVAYIDMNRSIDEEVHEAAGLYESIR